MFKSFLTKFILVLPMILFSDTTINQPIKLIPIQNTSQIQEEKPTQQAIEEAVKEDTKTDNNNIDEQLEKQQKILDKVIENINNETYLQNPIKDKEYTRQIDFLSNKININKSMNNTLAVKRDELKRHFLQEEKRFNDTLKSIVLGKQEFKDKGYFDRLLNENIAYIDNIPISEYTSTYQNEKEVNNTISKEFTKNYVNLYNQSNTQSFILKYLRDNMEKYRKTNFLIDEFNLQYIINKIDSIKGISFISKLTSYYLKFTIGEIIVVLLIFLFTKLITKYIIKILAKTFTKFLIQKNTEESKLMREYMKISVDTPLVYALYTLALQLSMIILVKDPQVIQKVTPWINTLYMAIFTWAVYTILSNVISIYAHSLLEKYPNVRKEMIVFILRLIKVLLILVVLLFLFTQLGIDIKAIAASLGVGGIAIALASKDTLANFFGSLNIMTDNSFSQGDWIKTSDVEGTVVDIRMRTTRIRTFDNAMITIPNSQLANTHIVNWSKRIIGRRIKMSIGITYESKMEDIKNLKEDILMMLQEHPQIASNTNTHIRQSKTFEAFKREDLQGIKNTLLVFIDEFAGSSINILVYCFSKSPVWDEWLAAKEDVIIKISQLAQKNNCEFAYPTQAIVLKNDEIQIGKKEVENEV